VTKLFISVLMLIVGMGAMNVVNACGNCDHFIKSMEGRMTDKKRMPSIRVRDRVFQCAGVFEYVSVLDEMDKDLLYMKATGYTFERYSNSKTTGLKKIKFSELIPMHKLSNLYGVVRELHQ